MSQRLKANDCRQTQDRKISFVILHYGDYLLTVKAVRCIELLMEVYGEVNIVIVDNGTESSAKIQEALNSTSLSIHYLEIKKNVGFSKGNNYGYAYCRNNLKQDFIVVINNDVFIEQKDFITVLYDCYEKYSFYVAGPDVVCKRKGVRSNPMTKVLTGISQAISNIEGMEKNDKSLRFFLKEYLFELGAYKVYNRLFHRDAVNADKYCKLSKNPLLHGSCLIFSERFIEENDKAFVPEVFLYAEENYLQYRCYSNGWDTYYFPSLQVNHLESGSDKIHGIGFIAFYRKYSRQLKMKIKGTQQFVEYLREEQKKSDKENPFFH